MMTSKYLYFSLLHSQCRFTFTISISSSPSFQDQLGNKSHSLTHSSDVHLLETPFHFLSYTRSTWCQFNRNWIEFKHLILKANKYLCYVCRDKGKKNPIQWWMNHTMKYEISKQWDKRDYAHFLVATFMNPVQWGPLSEKSGWFELDCSVRSDQIRLKSVCWTVESSTQVVLGAKTLVELPKGKGLYRYTDSNGLQMLTWWAGTTKLK